MKRPFSHRRPIGPFSAVGDSCTITFKGTFTVRDPENVDILMSEVEDNMQARINDQFVQRHQETPVDDVSGIREDDEEFSFRVITSRANLNDEMEDMMIRQMTRELRRISDSLSANTSYEFIAE